MKNKEKDLAQYKNVKTHINTALALMDSCYFRTLERQISSMSMSSIR